MFLSLFAQLWNLEINAGILKITFLLLLLYVVILGKKFFNGGINKHSRSLEGKHVIITGGNSGIGLETAVELARLKAEVWLACRASEKTETAVKLIRERSGNDRVYAEHTELDDLASVEEFCRFYLNSGKPLHLLINNAGVMGLEKLTLTKDGFEQQFGVNYLAHVLLTERLLPLMTKTGEGRVIHVSSDGHKFATLDDFSNLNSEISYVHFGAYIRSKLAQVVYSGQLNRRLKDTGVTSNVVHPGAVRTDMPRNLLRNPWIRAFHFVILPFYYYFFKDPWHGAQTTLYAALSPECGETGGKYYADCESVTPRRRENVTRDLEERFWVKTKELLNLS